MLLILLSQHVLGQQSTTPCGLNYNTYKTIVGRNLPAFEMESVASQQHGSPKTSSEIVAYNFKTDFTPNRDGAWQKILPGVDSWFLKLHSKDAYGLALVITNIAIKPGEIIFVYNQNGMRGPYTNRNIPRSGILPLDFLPGDEIVIEYDVAENTSPGNFIIETVSHAYKNIFGNDHSKKNQTARYSDSCYLCLIDDAIAKERRAVVKLIVQYENTTRLCTGTLMNNTANDNKPYILTAEHCVTDQFDADRTVFVFDYEDEKCFNVPGQENLVLSGAIHRSSVFENDFTMLELYDKPPIEFHPYYAGWDVSDQSLTGVTCIHHAEGGPKKVSVSNGTLTTSTLDDGASRAANAYWKVARWDVGATEIGSSGASLLNKEGHVIGTLSGGSSQCGSPYNDYFEKLSSSWEVSPATDHQLKYWLDPIESGMQTLGGRDPFEDIFVNCDTLSNIKPGKTQSLLPYTNGEGYFAGYNVDNIATYAENFSIVDSTLLTGILLNVGSVNVEATGGVLVMIQKSESGIPGAILFESFIPYYRLTNDTINYVGVYPYVKVAGDFFVSYTISYSPNDLFALKQSAWSNNSTNTAFAKLSSGWVPMNTISPNGAASSLGIKIKTCHQTTLESPPTVTSISFYPNPVTTVLIGKLSDKARGKLILQVYDLQGRLQNIVYNYFENNVVITTGDLHPGMYFVRLSTSDGVHQFKFVKL